MTSRIRSNGSSDESSRRPTARVSSQTKRNATIARKTRSIREDRHGAVDVEERRLTVEQLDVLRPMADVGRVDLEVEEEDVLRARGDVAELEDELAVAARLADRRGLERVERDPLDPAGVEHEGRLSSSRSARIVKRDMKKSPLRRRSGE